MQYKFYQYPRGANKGGILKTEICPTISASSWENNCFLIEIEECNTKENISTPTKVSTGTQHRSSLEDNLGGGISRCVKTDNRLATLVMEEKRIIQAGYVNEGKHQQDFVQHEDGISRAICCGTHGSAPHLTKTLVSVPAEDTATTICLNSKVDGKQPSVQNRIYDCRGIASAVTCSFNPNVAEPRICALRGRNPENPNERSKSNGNYQQRLEVSRQETSNTLTSVQKDNLLLEPKVMQVGNIIDDSERDFKNPQCGRIYSADGLSPTLNTCQGGNREPKVLRINTATKQGYDEVAEGACFDGAYPDSTTRRGRVQENGNATPTLCTSNEVCYFESSEPEFRIRKLTPRECFRLMGVSENNIDKIQNAGISNSQQYKLAGNSIVVDVLYHIFRKAFIEKENECDQLTLF